MNHLNERSYRVSDGKPGRKTPFRRPLHGWNIVLKWILTLWKYM
jgi:hypothetical protein